MKVSRSLSLSATALAAAVFWSFVAYGDPAAPPAAQATACPATATVPTAAAATQIVVATQVPNPAVPETAPPSQPPSGVDSSFQVRYSTNLAIGDSVVDFRPPVPAPATPPAANLTATPTIDCATTANTIPAASAMPANGSMAPIADEPPVPTPPANLKCKAGKVPAQLTRRSGKTVWRCVKSTAADR